jgi:hypothetical protein
MFLPRTRLDSLLFMINHAHDDEGCSANPSSRWLPSRTVLSKFDGTNLVDWLENYKYFFSLSHTPEFYKM